MDNSQNQNPAFFMIDIKLRLISVWVVKILPLSMLMGKQLTFPERRTRVIITCGKRARNIGQWMLRVQRETNPLASPITFQWEKSLRMLLTNSPLVCKFWKVTLPLQKSSLSIFWNQKVKTYYDKPWKNPPPGSSSKSRIPSREEQNLILSLTVNPSSKGIPSMKVWYPLKIRNK